MTTMRDDGYNGWTNFETWSVEVIVDNDEGLDKRRARFVRNNLPTSVKPKAAAARVREWVTALLDEARSRRHPRRAEHVPRAVDQAAKALLALAVERINWAELARSWGEANDDNASDRPAARQAAREAREKQWAKVKPGDFSAPPPAEHKAATEAVAALLKPKRRGFTAVHDESTAALRDAMKEYVEEKLHAAGWTAPEGHPINGLIAQLVSAGLDDVDLFAMAREWIGPGPEREPLTDLTGCDV